PARDPRSLGQLEIDLDGANGLPLDGLLGHVRREPARVLEHESEPEGALGDGLRLERADFEPWRHEREEEREVRVGLHLRLEAGERRVEPEVDDVPAAELDRTELRMLERVPVHVSLSLAELVREPKDRELVLR